jgi:hypothetical protein
VAAAVGRRVPEAQPAAVGLPVPDALPAGELVLA